MQRATHEPWTLVPFQSLGPVRFGMTRDEVQAVLGDGVQVSEHRVAYDAAEAQIEYDDEGRVETISAYPERPVVVQGATLQGERPVTEMAAELERLGYQGEDDGEESTVFPALGLALYAPTGVVEGLFASREG